MSLFYDKVNDIIVLDLNGSLGIKLKGYWMYAKTSYIKDLSQFEYIGEL